MADSAQPSLLKAPSAGAFSEAFRTRLRALYRARSAGFSRPSALPQQARQCAAAHAEKLVPVWLEKDASRTLAGLTLPAFAEPLSRLAGARNEGGALVLSAETLPEFALALRDAGLSQGWRNEALDLCSLARPDAVIGRLERAAFRAVGALTRAVHLSARVRNPENERDPVYLIGQRSHKKRVGPGRWDGLAAGMVSAGEAPEAALRREAMEEAGLPPGMLEDRIDAHGCLFIARSVEAGWMNELSFAYSAKLPEDFRPQAADGEVERFALVSAEEALGLIEADAMMREAALALMSSMAAQAGVVLA